MTLNKIYKNIIKHHPLRIYVPQLALPPTAHRLNPPTAGTPKFSTSLFLSKSKSFKLQTHES